MTALTPANASPQVPMASASATDPAAGQAEKREHEAQQRDERSALAKAATASAAASGA